MGKHSLKSDKTTEESYQNSEFEKKYNSHTKPLLKELHMLKMEDILILNQLQFFYKFINKDLLDFLK